MWSMLYTAWQYIRDGEGSRHESLGLCLLSFRKSISP